MIKLAEVTALLQSCWAAEGPADVPTQFPGLTLDVSRLTRWYEFWITSLSESPQRFPRQEVETILIDVHCFARDRQKHSAAILADAVRNTLAHRTLSWSSGEPAFAGSLRIHEATCRDLSRLPENEPRLGWQHLVVSLRARAEAFTPSPTA